MPNPVTRWQIVAQNPERVAAFYRDVFGWTLRADNALGYRELSSGAQRGIDGGVWPNAPDAPNLVQLFIEVDDLDAYVARVVAAGARLLIPPAQLPDGDRMALLIDVAGLSFGLFTPRSTAGG
jgi:predicted enzyme related to lactoylglutathione lyase